MMLPLFLVAMQVPTTVAVTAPAQAAKPKLICETEDEIGSRLHGKRVCHSQAEWDQIRNSARQSVESHQNNMNANVK